MEAENRAKRSSIFTVRNAENAMITFTIFALSSLLVVLFHEILIKNQSFVDALYSVGRNITQIMSAATMLTIFEEATDIMFQRIRDTLKKERELKAQVSAEAKAKGRAEGRAEGIVEGRAEGIVEGRAEGITQGRAEGIVEGRAEGITQGRAEGRAEGITQGRAETYREIAEWNTRRMAAEERGEKFTEPPPIPPQNG